MSASLLLSWRDGVSAVPAEDGGVRVEGAGAADLTPAGTGGRGCASCDSPRRERRGPAGRPRPRPPAPRRSPAGIMRSQIVAGRGLVCRSVWAGGRRLATLVSVSRRRPRWPRWRCRPGGVTGSPGSRTCGARAMRLVLESPLAHARVVLHDSRVAALVCGPGQPGDRPGPGRSGRATLPAEAVPLLLVSAGRGRDGR